MLTCAQPLKRTTALPLVRCSSYPAILEEGDLTSAQAFDLATVGEADRTTASKK